MSDNVLRSCKTSPKGLWTKRQLAAGLKAYQAHYGRFPTAQEIDAYEYLPSSRSIQRSFGGLVKMRNELLPGEITNYTKGSYRSAVAARTWAKGVSSEEVFYRLLIDHFEEIAIHEQKIIRPGNVRSDFFVYLNGNSGIVIDIFNAANLFNLRGVVNIKLPRYSLIKPPTYLILVGNEEITQEMIELKEMTRRAPLPAHIKVCTEDYFVQYIIPKLKNASAYTRRN